MLLLFHQRFDQFEFVAGFMGQLLKVEHWSNAGQTLVHRRSTAGQTPVNRGPGAARRRRASGTSWAGC
jgi:hypothetical protein